jgi:putative endonuclease
MKTQTNRHSRASGNEIQTKSGRAKYPCVYILASEKDGYLYVGVTSNLLRRVYQHKSSVLDGYTKQHQVGILVWYEIHDVMESAIRREKAIKKWNRAWKIELINSMNPQWCDLYINLAF